MMGAAAFSVIGNGRDVDLAFADAVSTARVENGDYWPDGYSGTIAEKQSFKEFVFPGGWKNRATVDVAMILDELFQLLIDASGAPPAEALIDLVGPETADLMICTFNDKWGPAVALQVGESRWSFMGWASC